MRRVLYGLAVSCALLCAAPVFAHSDRDDKDVRVPSDRGDRDARDQERDAKRDADRSARDAKRQSESRDARSASEDLKVQDAASDSSGSESGSSSSSGSGSGSGEVSVSTQYNDDHSGSGSSGSGDSGSGGSSGDDGDHSGSNGSGGNDDDEISSQLAGAREPVHVDIDRQGRERRAGEVIVVGRRADVDALRARGYAVIAQQRFESSEGVIARVRVGADNTIERAVATLQVLAPDARVSPNYLFRPSGVTGSVGAGAAITGAPSTRGRIGIIDTGVDAANARLRGAVGAVRSFAGAYTPREHGTGVAQVAVDAGVSVTVADVFEVDPAGVPVSSVDAIVRGLDWFIAQRVPVVNVSITGPNNVVLADMVARARRQGMVIVAAAGNDGPSAAPAFPAALEGVVAVTAIDDAGRVYRRANRGSYIDFAAVGVRVQLAGSDGATRPVSGTSFAAPRVAAVVARRLADAPAQGGDGVVRRLAEEALDLGPRGRDPIYGWGQIASD